MVKAKKRMNAFVSVLRNRKCAAALLVSVLITILFTVSTDAKTVSIHEGPETVKTVSTMRTRPSDILDEAGIDVNDYDKIEFSGFKDGEAKLVISRGFFVTVVKDAIPKRVRMFSGNTVAQALVKSGVYVTENEALSRSTDSLVQKDMIIEVNPVEYREFAQVEEIPYESTEVNDANLYEGTSQVVTEGEVGQKSCTVRQTLIKGKVVNQEILQETVMKEPVGEVIAVGTLEKKAAVTTAKTVATTPAPEPASVAEKSTQEATPAESEAPTITVDGTPVAYTSLITGKATAYTASAGAFTASGRPAQYGNIAVNPSQIPYGTRMYITSADGSFVYGYAVAADTGGFAGGSIIADLFFNTLSECYSFGVRNINIYILA